MTKADAFYILANTIRGFCLSDITYSEKPSVNIMIATLSEIDATVNTLFSVLGKEQADDRTDTL